MVKLDGVIVVESLEEEVWPEGSLLLQNIKKRHTVLRVFLIIKKRRMSNENSSILWNI